jgi:hypothetical protein
MATQNSPLAIPSTVDTFVLNTSLAEYRGRLVDNAYNANVLLRLYNTSDAKELIDGGTSIVENLVETIQNDGGFYLGADVLSNTQSNSLTIVEYKWQNMYEPIVITRDEERANSGDVHRILSLVGTKTMLSEKAIAKRAEQALSTPVGSANNLLDLETIIDSAGACGSINGTTDTFWGSTETASGAFATQGLSDMATAYYAVSSSANEDNPTHIFTGKTMFKAYEDTRMPLERISNGNLTANAGFRNLTFKGIPVLYGNYVAAGLMFGLNLNYLKLYVDSMTDFVTTDFINPSNQTVRVAYILWRGNQGTNNRRRLFKLTGLS